MNNKISTDEFTSAVANALLDHVLWNHLEQEGDNEV